MAARGLVGTFFINSGRIDDPSYLTLADLDTIALSGNEIAGHTVTHPEFSGLSADEIRRQVCEDRNTLLGWGFPVRSFAYPFGYATPEIKQIVADCGYNSARGLGGLRTIHPPDAGTGYSCESCAFAETVPPRDPMETDAPAQVRDDWTVDDLKNQVMSSDGGWVQLTFHGICPPDCSDITAAQDRFDQFTAWLADQQAQGKLIVRTVGDVIGGPVSPPVQAPPKTTTLVNPGLEANHDGVPSCWMRAGYGNNHPEFSTVSTAHTGTVAEKLVMRDYVDGDAKLMPTEDLGSCSVEVRSGSTPTISAWYTSTVPTNFTVAYRLARGVWVTGVLSSSFPPANTWQLASFTLPPLPPQVTAISFGLALSQDGELITDDYGLRNTGGPP